eukprot:CAMPEP_0194247206 /NCGR_PEP_ID=MMETSP0158-20130606/16222_1 /TAXON_ID=33649 /ORGANISM="Thalassionema nitzschioides, Strain L26-B" /LENGTH=356 /DNA_ID=CAMNT_0038983265 /DNA_START=15 /DNA_END=1081 /DNA_ORIENTATION=+
MTKVKGNEKKRAPHPRLVVCCVVAMGAIFTLLETHQLKPVFEDDYDGIANGASINYARTDPSNPLAVPRGRAPNLPSIRVEDKQLDKRRHRYGGAGDKQHLGGFSEIDPGGISIPVFKHMIEKIGVKSLLDVGCGRGFSTSWFVVHGVDAMCAEGSHDAIERTIIPESDKRLVEHDFSRGPWWPEKTYDAAWSVEFLEHVGIQYHFNYVSAFRKAAILFVTASTNTGWHHVEVHKPAWWIRKYESYGFKYDEELSNQLKGIARAGKKDYTAPNGVFLDGFYVRTKLMVFVNPVVAAMPEHAHLFAELGCGYIIGGAFERRPCSAERGESPLPESMYPLNLTQAMDDEWSELVRANV